jgi:hypothetical protein
LTRFVANSGDSAESATMVARRPLASGFFAFAPIAAAGIPFFPAFDIPASSALRN